MKTERQPTTKRVNNAESDQSVRPLFRFAALGLALLCLAALVLVMVRARAPQIAGELARDQQTGRPQLASVGQSIATRRAHPPTAASAPRPAPPPFRGP